jgi:hypothetical protein
MRLLVIRARICTKIRAQESSRKMRQLPRRIRTDVSDIPETGAHTPNIVVGEELWLSNLESSKDD